MKFFLYILLGIVILLLMVVIHEFGHYIAGKILKFKIDEFSVGFGPKLLQKKKKNGEAFTLRLIPLGGYCAFAGEDNADGTTLGKNGDKKTEVFQEIEGTQQSENSAPAQSAKRDYLLFDEQKPWKRIIVFIAGPLFNFLSAIIFSFIFILAIGFAQPTVEYVFSSPDGGVYNPLIKGDVIIAVNDKEINVLNSYSDLIGKPELGNSLTLTVLRNGKEVRLENVKVQHVESVDKDGNPIVYDGLGYQSVSYYKRVGVGTSLIYSVPMTLKFSWMILGTFGQLITGKIALTSLTGPVGTVNAFADVAMQNWRNILIWLPLIASNLAIFNILPIPALDGSKVVFTTIEWIRGKPVNKKVENIIHFAGLILLFAFVILVDLIGLFT